MKVREIYPNLFLYTFTNQYEMCSTFFRLQEFYESPSNKLRNKYFSYEKAFDVYANLKLNKKKEVKFTYFEDWLGFNIPGNIIGDFEDKFYNDFTDKEIKLLEETGTHENDNYYILGVLEKDKVVIQHEVGHGLYYLNKEYKKEMSKLIREMPKGMRKMAEKHLLKIGYCKAVLKDELHAYFATGIRRGMICIWHHIVYQLYIQRIRRVFKRYYKEIKL